MNDTFLLSAEDLAEHFGVTTQTIRDWVRRRRIPCIRPSRKVVRFRLADVERAIEQPVAAQENEQ